MQVQEFYTAMQALRKEDTTAVKLPESLSTPQQNTQFFRINSLTYEKDFPRLEAFENVVASINKPQCRLAYYLRGSRSGVGMYVGVVEDPDNAGELTLVDYSDILEKAFKGNFLGSKLTKEDAICNVFLQNNLQFSTVLGIPSRNKDKESISFQGVDRLINIMEGIDFHLLIIWEPVASARVEQFDASVKEIYGHLQRISKQSVQVSTQEGTQSGTSYQQTSGTNVSHLIGTGKVDGENKGWSDGGSSSSKSGGSSRQHSVNDSKTTGTSDSTSKGTSQGNSSSQSTSVTWEEQNKVAVEHIKYIDEELLPRLRQGRAKGMYRTAVYLASEHLADLQLLENAVKSIYQGDASTFFPLHIKRLPRGEATRKLVGSFSIYNNIEAQSALLPLCSRPIANHQVSLATWLTSSEISILAGLPQKEVPGLELREQVSFGLNITEHHEAQGIHLGHMYQEGNELHGRQVYLDRDALDKHLFIAGTTGSGKTTTCHKILHAAGLPFMVIEPAKTEYRALLNDPAFSDTLIFTLGNEKGVPFRFNPFEFLPGESLSAHVGQLKACFMASFDMEAAIPNILEEALYKTYEAFGWSFRDDNNRFLENRYDAWDCGGLYFPTLSDYIKTIKVVVNAKGFNERLRDEYLGSIRARLDSLRTGVKGLMFDTRLSIDFEAILDGKVIIELEELKSGEDKAFVMGLILGRMLEALKGRHKHTPEFRHITLVEEAHRLLTRPQAGDSSGRKLGVEMFSDMLAEVRKYGESLIIVDQIPNKLAPEVLKNTNTKIIHKLFARDDKEAVGDTMALDEKQRNYLSYLLKGEAVVFSQGWKKPIDVQIEKLGEVDTSKDIKEEDAFRAGWEYWLHHPWIFCPDCPKETTGRLAKEKIQKIEVVRADIVAFLNNFPTPSEYAACASRWMALKNRAHEILLDNTRAFVRNSLLAFYLNRVLPRVKNVPQDIEAFQEELAELEGVIDALVISPEEHMSDVFDKAKTLFT